MRAAENGKQVAVSIELKARFDEENNIRWARALEHAGAHVFYGDAGLKTHAKMVLVVRREGDGPAALRAPRHRQLQRRHRPPVHRPRPAHRRPADRRGRVASCSTSLSGFSKKSRYRKLAVAPIGLRRGHRWRRSTRRSARARAGAPARIFAKMNALVDTRVIRGPLPRLAGGRPDRPVRARHLLPAPGRAGRLRQHPGASRSSGRFLEHERVFVFGPEGEESFFLASADWMPRNLDRRVEVMFPIESEKLREQIRQEVIEPLRAEQGCAYEMKPDGTYQRRPGASGQPLRSPQSDILDRLQGRPPPTPSTTGNGTPAP